MWKTQYSKDPKAQYFLMCYVEDTIFKKIESDFEQNKDAWKPQSHEEHIKATCSNFHLAPFGPSGLTSGGSIGFAIEALHVAENVEAVARTYDRLNAHQRQEIRVLANNLRVVADRFPIQPLRNHLFERRIFQNEELDEEEMQVVNNIYSITSTTTVSMIAEYLVEKLTPHTLRAALQFICYSASSVPEELTLVCELAKVTHAKIKQLARSGSIYEVIGEFIEDKLNFIMPSN